MEAERWQRIERLYHSALGQEASHRAVFLKQACGGDHSLLREVESALAQSGQSEDFLEAPALDVAAKALAISAAAAGERTTAEQVACQEYTRAGPCGPIAAVRPGSGLVAGVVF